MYTDGATKDNPGPSGYGLHGTDSEGHQYNIWAALSPKASNNRAEMMGYITAIRLARHMGWRTLTVYTDSEYVELGSKKRMRGYAKNNWRNHKGGIVPNRDLWELMIAEEDAYRAIPGNKINLQWVRGHAGNEGNERADRLAVRGRLAAEKGEITHGVEIIPPSENPTGEAAPAKKPKPKPSDYPRLLAGKRFMFVTKMRMQTEDGWSIYMTNTYSDKKGEGGRYCGKPDADNLQSVLLMREGIPQIDAIVEYQNSITPDDYNTPVVGMLDRIVRPDTWSMLTEHGKTLLRHQRLNIMTPDKEPITEYRRPPRLAFYEVDRFQLLLEYLDQYRTGQLDQRHVFDVTAWFYSTDKKNNQKLLPDIGGQAKYVSVPIEVHGQAMPLKLTIGLDVPPRVNLSGVVKQHGGVKVSVVLYGVGTTAFRYAVVFEAEDHYAIFASMAANFKPILRTPQPTPEAPAVPVEVEAPPKKRKKCKKKKKTTEESNDTAA